MYHNKGMGSPGRDLESRFDVFLSSHPGIRHRVWLSQNNKTPYDFKVYCGTWDTPSPPKFQLLFIDVVGTYHTDKRLRLITAQKNWSELHEFCKNNCEGGRFREYLAFMHKGLWRFLRVKEDMPSYDLYLSRSAMRGIRDFESIIRDNRPIKTQLATYVKGMYAPRAKKEALLHQWLSTDFRV